MGNNSIRNNLSREDIISDIRMSLAASLNKSIAVFVVEGPDDIQFWQNKISENVYLYESFSGIDGVKEIVNFFNQPFVVGVCDQDYDTSQLRYIFNYDFCCLEMMLINNDSAFMALISEYYPRKNPHEVRLRILNELQWLSCFRRLNYINSWGIKFKGLSINKSCDIYSKCFCVEKAVYELTTINQDQCEIHQEMLEYVLQESKVDMSLYELLEVTNGHDFLHYLHFLYVNERGRKGKVHGVATISASLRCAFRMPDFIHTDLYAKLKKFELECKVVLLQA